jgi:hypothetical protein
MLTPKSDRMRGVRHERSRLDVYHAGRARELYSSPFMKAGILAGGVALLVILYGVGLFFRLCDPLIRRLEEGEVSTQAILDTAPDGIITFDSRGAIQSVNHAAERLFGYTADEVIGQQIDRLMPTLIGAYGDNSLKSGQARGLRTGLGVSKRRPANIGMVPASPPMSLSVKCAWATDGSSPASCGTLRSANVSKRSSVSCRRCKRLLLEAFIEIFARAQNPLHDAAGSHPWPSPPWAGVLSPFHSIYNCRGSLS